MGRLPLQSEQRKQTNIEELSHDHRIRLVIPLMNHLVHHVLEVDTSAFERDHLEEM